MKNVTAFSLVELSIVLVILGLLTGGILAGQSLIRAAELRSISTDIDRYAAATNSFRDKYFGIPGDITNAEKFWGPWSTSGTAASVAGAKNGNGDGSFWNADSAWLHERVQYFRHLSLAGLIEGNYAGNYAEPATVYTVGVNVPSTRLGPSTRVIPTSNMNPAQFLLYGMRGSYLIVQGVTSPYPFITPSDAWNIDTKRDDGNPSMGAVMGVAEGAAASRNCTTNDNWETAGAGASTYKLDVASKECWMAFWLR